MKDKETRFYNDIYEQVPDLYPFMPKVYGFERKEKETTIIMQNMSHNGNFNTMDIKLSDVYKDKYNISDMFQSGYKINLTGYKIVDAEGDILEKRRGFYSELNKKRFFELLRRFFRSEKDQQVDIDLIQKIIKFLTDLKALIFKKDY